MQHWTDPSHGTLAEGLEPVYIQQPELGYWACGKGRRQMSHLYHRQVFWRIWDLAKKPSGCALVRKTPCSKARGWETWAEWRQGLANSFYEQSEQWEKQGRQGSWKSLTVQSPASLQMFSSKLQLLLMAEEVLILILKMGKLTLKPWKAYSSQTDSCPTLSQNVPATSVQPSCDYNRSEQGLTSLLHFSGNFHLCFHLSPSSVSREKRFRRDWDQPMVTLRHTWLPWRRTLWHTWLPWCYYHNFSITLTLFQNKRLRKSKMSEMFGTGQSWPWSYFKPNGIFHCLSDKK